jgi:hypothetical protein
VAVLAIAAWLVAHPQVAVALVAVLGALLAIAVLSVALAAAAVAVCVAGARARTDVGSPGHALNAPNSDIPDATNREIEE